MPPNAKSSADERWLNSLMSVETMDQANRIMQFPAVVERFRSSGPGYLEEVLSKRSPMLLENQKANRCVDRMQKETKAMTSSSMSLQVDSDASSFQSMDGLSTSFPLARREARKKLEERYIALKKKAKKSRKHHASSFSITTNACGSGCLDSITPVAPKEEHTDQLRRELLILKRQLKQIKKHKTRRVHFADPLVADVRYRPYTDACDIKTLYFQEEELDLLEEDRYLDPGDAVECELVESVRAISVVYLQRCSPDD